MLLLYIEVTFTIFRSSGKIHLTIERLNKSFKGSYISPKHFFITLKLTPSWPGLLFVLSEKKASFSSFIDNGRDSMLALTLVI